MKLTLTNPEGTMESIVVGSRVDHAGNIGVVTAAQKGWFSVLFEDSTRKNLRANQVTIAPPQPAEVANAPIPADVAASKLKAKPPKGDVRPLGTPKVAKAPKGERAPKAPKALHPCCCGCGEMVSGFFKMGHDARFHGWMRKLADGRLEVKDIPASAAKLMNIVNGVPTTDYDGSAWTAPAPIKK